VKFGNDYALGLRWLRHLGLSRFPPTRPRCRAYQDEPASTGPFRRVSKRHPNAKVWLSSPLESTEMRSPSSQRLLALWDNLHVFRPIFFNLRETSGGGVVSFQLNPNIAHLVEESIRDVFHGLSARIGKTSPFMDRYLLAGFRMAGDQGKAQHGHQGRSQHACGKDDHPDDQLLRVRVKHHGRLHRKPGGNAHPDEMEGMAKAS